MGLIWNQNCRKVSLLWTVLCFASFFCERNCEILLTLAYYCVPYLLFSKISHREIEFCSAVVIMQTILFRCSVVRSLTGRHFQPAEKKMTNSLNLTEHWLTSWQLKEKLIVHSCAQQDVDCWTWVLFLALFNLKTLCPFFYLSLKKGLSFKWAHILTFTLMEILCHNLHFLTLYF